MILAEILENNKIIINEKENSQAVSNGVLFETISFIFPESWEGYTKTVVFTTSEKTINVILENGNGICISDSECYIPHEVLQSDEFELSVFGVKGESIATTTKYLVKVLESGYAIGDSPIEPTKSEYQQIIEITEYAKNIAESVRKDADNGLFKGEKGDKGDRGEKGVSGVYIGKEEPTDENVNVWIDSNGESNIASDSKLKDFIDNTDIDYAYDSATNANYTIIRIYKNKIDGTKQYPFVYAPNGIQSGTKTTYDLSNEEGWLFAINAGVFDMSNCKPDGIIIQNGEVLQSTPTTTHSQCKPLTIDVNGNLSYAEYNANADTLVDNGIISAVTGFIPIIVDYKEVLSKDWNNVLHYTENAQRQIIGQFGNGDYAIITCEGRNFDNSDGWTIEEAQNICKKHGLKFAYNLDGGGSTETMLGLKNINTIYEGTTGRKVPTFIVFNGSNVFAKPSDLIVTDEPNVSNKPEYIIPNEYTEVEYIKADGNQYINTGIPETELYSFEYKALNENWTVQAGHILSSVNTFYPFMKVIDGTKPWICNKVWDNEQESGDCEVTTDKSQAYILKGVYDDEKYTVFFNGTSECTVLVGTTKSSTNTYHLFAYGGNPSNINYRFTGKLYYLKLTDINGNIVYNFVPVKNSSGIYGLYETVNGIFYDGDTDSAFSGA